MSRIQYISAPINNTPTGFIPEYNDIRNNDVFTPSSAYSPIGVQPQQQQVNLAGVNPQLFANNNNSPVLLSNVNMGLPIIDENSAIKRFNVNATRSSSSSSTSSSAMSSMSMYQNKYTNDSDPDLFDLKQRNDMSKLFEDDIFYCPRTLLSPNDIQKADMIIQEQNFNHNNNIIQNNPIIESPNSTQVNMHPAKFNPYTSKSFNPTAF